MEKKSPILRKPVNRKGYGLCLSGGGAKGAYQIGCWRAFLEMGLDFEAVAGSSVGALNAAFICQGDYGRAEHFWSHVSSEQVLRVDSRRLHRLAARAALELAFFALPLPFKARRAIRYIRYGMTTLSLLSQKGSLRQLLRDGLFDADSLEQTIDKYLDFDTLTASGKTLIISTLQFARVDSLRWGRIRYHRIDTMTPHDIKRLLLASASIPMLFPAVEMNGLYHRDGAVLVKIPVRPLYDLGIRKIIAVHLKTRKHLPHRRFSEASIVDISPGRSLGQPAWGTLNFTPDMARVCLDMGYRDAMKALRLHAPA
jgi:NTE family protein